jgi:hypothetical protein
MHMSRRQYSLEAAHARGSAAAEVPRTSLSLARTSTGSVYSKFELIKIKLKNLFLGANKFNVSYGNFSKTVHLPPPAGFPKLTQFLLRRQHGLRTCIPRWVGPRAGLDDVERRKALAPAGNRTLAVQPLARGYTH